MIFEENGFDIEIIGIERIKTATRRWKQSYDKDGLLGLQDSRKDYSGRPKNKELSDSEKMAKLETKIRLLEIENEFF